MSFIYNPNFISGLSGIQCSYVDNTNKLYVTNFNVNLLKFDATTGNPELFTTSQLSSMPGIIGVVADNSNNLYSISYSQGVNKYNATTGSLITSSILSATGTPYNGCCDSNNNLYVCYINGANPNSGFISKYIASDNSKIQYFIGQSGTYANGLFNPEGVYVDKNNILYVSNTGLANGPYYIGKYNALTGQTINAKFITLNTSPCSLIGDSNDNLYVATGTVISVYNTTTGELINANFLTNVNFASGISNTLSLSSSSTYLYFSTSNSTVGKYSLYTPPPPPLCFKEDTKILTIDGYKQIQLLKPGDLLRTSMNGYMPIYEISKRIIEHNTINERIKHQLYKCSPENYNDLFEELIITGCHSILVDNFISEEEKESVININGDTYVTDKKYRLPACVDKRATVYEKPGNYTIYHVALEHEDEYMNYGIYANGLLVESCSKIHLDKSFMTGKFIE